MQRIDNILFPIDFSECSHKACPYAIEVATKFNAQIHLLFVAQDLSYLSAEDTASQKWLDMTNQIALSGEEQMEAFCKRHKMGVRIDKTGKDRFVHAIYYSGSFIRIYKLILPVSYTNDFSVCHSYPVGFWMERIQGNNIGIYQYERV